MTDHEVEGRTPPALAGMCLEIVRGRTQFLRRPLQRERFLIGAGSNCDLQFADSVPMVHSVLTHRKGSWHIETLAGDPPLRVNGAEVRDAVLAEGDRIEIAGFVLRFARHQIAEPVPSEIVSSDEDSAEFSGLLEATAANPETLTAAELADHIESALNLLEQVQERQRSGLQALVRRALEEGQSPVTTRQEAAESFSSDLPMLLERVDRRLEELGRHEADLQTQLKTLLKQQAQVQSEIDGIAPRLAPPGPNDADDSLRKSA